MPRFLIAAFVLAQSAAATANISVTDDTGRVVALSRPAERVVSLAPHATEMLFAVGAGPKIVGTTEFSDHPQSAREISRIGKHDKLDLERIIGLEPDLVIGWQSGNPLDEIAHLKRLGVPVFMSEPRRLQDIASTFTRLGRLTGNESRARAAVKRFRARERQVFPAVPEGPPVRVFYQIWSDPLITLNGEHLVSEIIRRCGGKNVFDGLPVIAPRVDIEAVIERDPDVIIGGAPDSEQTGFWRRWPTLRAVRTNQLYSISADLMHRHTPRILEGAAQMCAIFQQVRVAWSG